MRVLLAAFHTPGIRAIECLIGTGCAPGQIRLLTHETERNSPLIAFARSHTIDVRTFAVNSADAHQWCEDFSPDVLFSLYFRKIVPARILRIPSRGAINLHPSLLPAYRGTFSAAWAIINGEERTGITYHHMLPEVDAGPIVKQVEVPIHEQDTAYSLYHRLLMCGMQHFGEVVQLAERRYPGRPQVGQASYYKRQLPHGGYIDPSWGSVRIERFIRGMFFPPFRPALVRLRDGSECEVSTMDEYENLKGRGCVSADNDPQD